ncbi:MAG: zinc ribbon domain-containing protein [Pyrinomonadaceae bacterium]
MAEQLYCPRCGKQFSDGTSYCRTCGLSLDGVSDIVSGEDETKPVVTRRPNFKLFRIGIALFILGLVIGLINGALKDFELFPQSYGKLIFMLFVAAGMLTLGAGFLFPTKKYTKRKPSTFPADPDAKLDTAPLAGSLTEARSNLDKGQFPKDDREFEKIPAASVTEHTTRDLDK